MLKNNFSGNILEAGCDEAGRGCLAGPVFAAVVILPIDFKNEILNDSKQLSAKQRDVMRQIIINNAICWAVASVDHNTIDEINILNASILAMHNALNKLEIKPEIILVDGNRFKDYQNIPYKCIIKGDSEYMSIAAASILAKTFRDDYMKQLHNELPYYNWISNKGYGTLEHRKAIVEFGMSIYHRKSFHLNNQIKIGFLTQNTKT